MAWRAAPGGGKAGRRWDLEVRQPGDPAGAGARDGTADGAVGAARDGAGGPEWRHDGVPASAPANATR